MTDPNSPASSAAPRGEVSGGLSLTSLGPSPPEAGVRERIKDWASVFQSVFTVLAIMTAGIWFLAGDRLSTQAEIENAITYRCLTPAWRWVRLSVTIKNVGERAIKIPSLQAYIQKVLPLEAPMVQSLDQGYIQSEAPRFLIPFPKLTDTVTLSWGRPLRILPHESDRVEMDFQIPTKATTILIYTDIAVPDSELHWTRHSVHELDQALGVCR